jgi:hypothetical protein
MAISKTTTFKGCTIADAYHRVWNVKVSKDSVSFGLGVHSSSDDEMIDSTSHSCAYNLDGDNPIKQAYQHVKTLPEFAGATDA